MTVMYNSGDEFVVVVIGVLLYGDESCVLMTGLTVYGSDVAGQCGKVIVVRGVMSLSVKLG